MEQLIREQSFEDTYKINLADFLCDIDARLMHASFNKQTDGPGFKTSNLSKKFGLTDAEVIIKLKNMEKLGLIIEIDNEYFLNDSYLTSGKDSVLGGSQAFRKIHASVSMSILADLMSSKNMNYNSVCVKASKKSYQKFIKQYKKIKDEFIEASKEELGDMVYAVSISAVGRELN